ncbi:Synaptobrevin-like protein [Nosema bombycis CQ1]|uniref:Synaptobrevin-like protein n=1 Tax=Nosema bombycis (strain CQ1 / CVCC 102059) TaxID=578461 RepID=R0KLI7_NOSB1|nr:Synaptobrevin-like protein [Nosema bombycis CQ1]|eukprot:EOB11481.1 Synaptobrevin-like protein [Nosema bombycis CQ1]
MSLYSLVIINIHSKQILEKYFYLKEFSFFTRSSVKEAILMISQEVSNRIENYEFQSFFHTFNDKKTYLIFTKVYGEELYVSCGDGEYLPSIANLFFEKVYKDNDRSLLLEDFQDSKSKDTLGKIKNEITETKEVCIKTLNSLFERGEKLDDLIDKSEQLSKSSKMFYKAAHKRNRCC